MGNRKGPDALRLARTRPTLRAIFYFPLSIFLFPILLGGCAAPAEPIERKAPVPKPVADLGAAQAGNDVVLQFSLPKETVDHRALKQPPAIEIYRVIRPVVQYSPAPSAVAPAPQLILTIPSAMVDQYSDEGRIRVVDSLNDEDFQPGGENIAEYTVRTRASPKKQSADSNSATLHIYPAADPIADLMVETSRAGIILTWSPPGKTLIGTLPTVANYRIYRAEANTAGTAAPSEGQNLRLRMPLLKIGEGEPATYRDTLTESGKTYFYSVRSVVKYPNALIESGDSNFAIVTRNDSFPPAPPQGLVVVFVPAVGETSAHIELSWAINPETDIAGYNVYRSEQEDTPGTRLNPELLLTPAFRDMNAVSGRRYFYSITAVDRSGNESPAGAAASGGVPEENRQAP